ncbi:hypothetical protein D3C72_2180220 [compost metagenome]
MPLVGRDERHRVAGRNLQRRRLENHRAFLALVEHVHFEIRGGCGRSDKHGRHCEAQSALDCFQHRLLRLTEQPVLGLFAALIGPRRHP